MSLKLGLGVTLLVAAICINVPSYSQQAPVSTTCTARFTDPEPINPGGWIIPDYYPARALDAGIEGTARVRFFVNALGRIESAEIVTSSGNKDLDDETIRQVTRRARFRPATRNCVPVPGEHTRNFVWALPD